MPSETSADMAGFLPDGKTFAFSSPANVRFVSVPDLRDAGMLDCTSGGFVRPKPAISADGTKLVVVCNGNLTVWSLPDRRRLTTIVAEGRFNRVLQLSPDGVTAATGDPRGPVRLWNLAEGRAGAVLHGHSGPVVSLAFTADGKRLVSGSWDGSVGVWSVAEGTALTVFAGHRGAISHLHITPDGSTIISGQTSTLGIGSSTSVRMVKADALIALWDVSPPRFRRFLGR
jgi:WD40 repeat protein